MNLRELVNLIRGVAARAVVRNVKQEGLERVQLEQAPGDLLDDVEVFGGYGFASAQLPGAENVRAYMRGCPEHPIVIAVADRRHRPTDLQPGDACIHNDKGDRVLLKSSRALDATIGGSTISADASHIELAVGSVSIEITSAGVTITSPSGVTTFV